MFALFFLLLVPSLPIGSSAPFEVLASIDTDGLVLPPGNATVLRNIGNNFLASSYGSYAGAAAVEYTTDVLWLLDGSDTTTLRNVFADTCLDDDSDYPDAPGLNFCDAEATTQQWNILRTPGSAVVHLQAVQSKLFLGFSDWAGGYLGYFPEPNSTLHDWIFLSVEHMPSRIAGRLQPDRSVPAFPSDLSVVWPNAVSAANSDDWLITNHQSITQMQPRVLLLNFLNGYTASDILAQAQTVAVAVGQSSRYQAYRNASAPVFLDYRIDKLVMLSDASRSSPIYMGDVSSYSLEMPPTDYTVFTQAWDTGALFNSTFAEIFGYPDPTAPGQFLSLCSLFQRGMVHEVWMTGWPAELHSYAPRYDLKLQRGRFDRCAGNGCFKNASMAGYCNVTIRMHGLLMDRGAGCSLHSMGHAMESDAYGETNLYYGQQSQRFYNDQLNRTYPAAGTLRNLYDLPQYTTREIIDYTKACPYPVIYNSSSSATITVAPRPFLTREDDARSNATSDATCGDSRVFIENIWQGCGNVHWSPNSRYSYDSDFSDLRRRNTSGPVLNTCENYGLHNGDDGHDIQTLYTYNSTAVHVYDLGEAGDCEGGWLTYMGQSMPGLNNHAVEEGSVDRPMLNWWPFRFY